MCGSQVRAGTRRCRGRRDGRSALFTSAHIASAYRPFRPPSRPELPRLPPLEGAARCDLADDPRCMVAEGEDRPPDRHWFALKLGWTERDGGCDLTCGAARGADRTCGAARGADRTCGAARGADRTCGAARGADLTCGATRCVDRDCSICCLSLPRGGPDRSRGWLPRDRWRNLAASAARCRTAASWACRAESRACCTRSASTDERASGRAS
jgi:hypothetical protein